MQRENKTTHTTQKTKCNYQPKLVKISQESNMQFDLLKYGQTVTHSALLSLHAYLKYTAGCFEKPPTHGYPMIYVAVFKEGDI